MRRLVRSLVPLAVLGLAACAREVPADWPALKLDIARRYPDVPSLTVAQLATAIEAGRAPVLLDARSREEFAVSHIEGALHAPDARRGHAAIERAGAGRPVVVYCSVGERSARLVQELRDAGLGGVRNLEGSLFEWANAGLPVVRDGQVVREVHPYGRRWQRFLDRERWPAGW